MLEHVWSSLEINDSLLESDLSVIYLNSAAGAPPVTRQSPINSRFPE